MGHVYFVCITNPAAVKTALCSSSGHSFNIRLPIFFLLRNAGVQGSTSRGMVGICIYDCGVFHIVKSGYVRDIYGICTGYGFSGRGICCLVPGEE